MHRTLGDVKSLLDLNQPEAPVNLRLCKGIYIESAQIAYQGRGLLYILKEEKEYDRAIADFEKVIEINPKYVNAYFELGNIYYAKGEYGKAIFNFTKTIELDETLWVAYDNRGEAYEKSGQKAKAEADYKTAKELRSRRSPN